LNTGNTSR